MYFAAEISFDPSTATELRRVKPSKAFAKFFYYMTVGLAGVRKEFETFTAVSVLQQINIALRSAGVTNIVRLARDGQDFYFDQAGRPDDLADAMKTFEMAEASQFSGKPFETISLVLEHQDVALKYLVQIDIARMHAPGEHPVVLTLNAALRTPAAAPDANTAKHQLGAVFTSQTSHDTYIGERRRAFEAFVHQVKGALAYHIGVDHITENFRTKLLRPSRRRRSNVDEIEYDSDWGGHHDPLFGGYYGFDEVFFHAWLWSELMHDHGVHAQQVTLVDESGHDVLFLGDQGIDPASSSALDPNSAMEVPSDPDALVYDGHAYAGQIYASAMRTGFLGTGTDASSWLDGMFDGGWSDGGSDDSNFGSSCGSSCASSCGSSCGGCGGD